MKNSRSATFLNYSAHDAKRLFLLLFSVELLLLLGYCVTQILLSGRGGPIAHLLNVDKENSIPTWFSSVQLSVIGVLLWTQARSTDKLKAFLYLLAACFLFLSMDEASAIHEKIIPSAERYGANFLLFLTFMGDDRAWMIPYLILGFILALASIRYLIYIWQNMRNEGCIVAVGLGLFAVGGIGIEFISFHVFDNSYYIAVAVEEFLEMIGMSIVLYGVMLSGLKLEAEHTLRKLQPQSVNQSLLSL